jgi:SAM-dependent methyltransferase
MLSEESWKPSKYVYRAGKLRASRDPMEVSIPSRLIVDLIAAFYQRHVAEHVKGHLLDLGCGKVPLYGIYKPYVKTVTCVDWPQSMHDKSYVDYELDITKPLPFANERFDTIILSDVLEHLATPTAIWKEMYRILAGDGKILISVPFIYGLHEVPHDYYRYTRFALTRFAEEIGLKIILLKEIGGMPEVMTDIFAKTIRRLPIMGLSIAAFVQWMTLKFIGTSVGRRISEATCEDLPLGYFLIVEK